MFLPISYIFFRFHSLNYPLICMYIHIHHLHMVFNYYFFMVKGSSLISVVFIAFVHNHHYYYYYMQTGPWTSSIASFNLVYYEYEAAFLLISLIWPFTRPQGILFLAIGTNFGCWQSQGPPSQSHQGAVHRFISSAFQDGSLYNIFPFRYNIYLIKDTCWFHIDMYNGIGLQTARGSGTNGYVQRNLSSVFIKKDKVSWSYLIIFRLEY